MRTKLVAVVVTSILASGSVFAQSPDTHEEVSTSVESGGPVTPKNVVLLRPRILPLFTSFGVGGTAGLTLQYERGLGDQFSVLVAPGLDMVPFMMPSLELGARYFFFGDAPHGFSAGLNVGGILATALGGTALLITPSAGVNYTGMWDSGFSMSVGIGVGYTIASGALASLPVGLSVPFQFGLGYAF